MGLVETGAKNCGAVPRKAAAPQALVLDVPVEL